MAADSTETLEETNGGGRGPTLSRRAVVGGVVGVASMFAVGGGVKAFAGDRDFLRPPGGQDYDHFVGACIKCDRCRSICDRGAIAVCTTGDGLLHARMPKMNYREGYCDTCDGEYRCIATCPTQALTSFDAEADKIGLAVIDTDECLTYSTSGHCDARCTNACAWDALYLNESGRLEIIEDRCNGCGACEYVCPSSTYGYYSNSNLRGINVESC